MTRRDKRIASIVGSLASGLPLNRNDQEDIEESLSSLVGRRGVNNSIRKSLAEALRLLSARESAGKHLMSFEIKILKKLREQEKIIVH